MWNLVEPELFTVEPLCGTSRNLVQGFGRLPQTTPKLYWKNPKLFKLLGNDQAKKNLRKIWGKPEENLRSSVVGKKLGKAKENLRKLLRKSMENSAET